MKPEPVTPRRTLRGEEEHREERELLHERHVDVAGLRDEDAAIVR